MLVMEYGEYRLSRDLDFLCIYGESFSRLRREVFNAGYAALFNSEQFNSEQFNSEQFNSERSNLAQSQGIQFPRDIRTDRYGLVSKSV